MYLMQKIYLLPSSVSCPWRPRSALARVPCQRQTLRSWPGCPCQRQDAGCRGGPARVKMPGCRGGPASVKMPGCRGGPASVKRFDHGRAGGERAGVYLVQIDHGRVLGVATSGLGVGVGVDSRQAVNLPGIAPAHVRQI